MRISKDLFEGSKKASSEAIEAMEQYEDWAISDEELNSKINQMLESFEDILKKKEINKDSFVRFLTYLHTGNMMAVLESIEFVDEEFLEELISHINESNKEQESRFSFTFANRIMILYRMYAIPQIFSKERIEQLKKGIKTVKEEDF